LFEERQKRELVSLLTELAEYVTLTSKGDRLKLLSSSFPISGASNTQIEQEIQQLDVELGPPGEATTRVKRVRAARAYMHQYTTEPPTSETAWNSEGCKFAFYTFRGLNSMES
jgi:hypothetical protein